MTGREYTGQMASPRFLVYSPAVSSGPDSHSCTAEILSFDQDPLQSLTHFQNIGDQANLAPFSAIDARLFRADEASCRSFHSAVHGGKRLFLHASRSK